MILAHLYSVWRITSKAFEGLSFQILISCGFVFEMVFNLHFYLIFPRPKTGIY